MSEAASASAAEAPSPITLNTAMDSIAQGKRLRAKADVAGACECFAQSVQQLWVEKKKKTDNKREGRQLGGGGKN